MASRALLGAAAAAAAGRKFLKTTLQIPSRAIGIVAGSKQVGPKSAHSNILAAAVAVLSMANGILWHTTCSNYYLFMLEPRSETESLHPSGGCLQ